MICSYATIYTPDEALCFLEEKPVSLIYDVRHDNTRTVITLLPIDFPLTFFGESLRIPETFLVAAKACECITLDTISEVCVNLPAMMKLNLFRRIFRLDLKDALSFCANYMPNAPLSSVRVPREAIFDWMSIAVNRRGY